MLTTHSPFTGNDNCKCDPQWPCNSIVTSVDGQHSLTTMASGSISIARSLGSTS